LRSKEIFIDSTFITNEVDGNNLFLMKSFSNNEYVFLFETYLLYQKHNIKYKIPLPDTLLRNGEIYFSCEKFNKSILMGTETGVFIFNPETQQINKLELGCKVFDIKIDPYKNVWMATNNGILIFNKKMEQTAHLKNEKESSSSLSYNFIQTLYMDKLNQMWVGTANKGINIYDFDFDKFLYIKPDKQKQSVVWSICKSSSELLYLGIDDGLHILEPYKPRGNFYDKDYTGKQFVLMNDRITSITEINNVIYFSLQHTGIFKLNANGTYNKLNDIKYVSELCIVDSIIYASTHYGFFSMNLHGENIKKFSVTNDNKGLSMSYLLSVKKGEKNTLWITGSNGISEYNSSTELFQHYPFFLKDKHVSGVNYFMNSCIHHTPENVYIASMGGGLNIFHKKQKSFTYITSKNGLQNDLLFSLTKIGDEIWMTSTTGISSYNIRTTKISNYSFDDGIKLDEFAINSIFSNKNEIYFGGTNGVLYFKPALLNKGTVNDAVFLEEILCNNETRFTAEKTFNENDKIEVVLYSENIKKNKLNRYEYFLQGFSKSWTIVPLNKITFSSLPPGTYNLKVRFNQSFENSTNVVLEIPFTIFTPFYKTRWFYFLLLIISVFTIYFIVYTITKQKEIKRKKEEQFRLKIEKEKEKISREMHDNIGVNITHIVNSISMIISQSDNDKNKSGLIELLGFTKNTMLNLRSAIWSLKQESISFKLLQLKITEIVQTLTKNKPLLSTHFEFSGNENYIVSSELSVHIIRMVQETVNNVLKHAEASKLVVSFHLLNNTLQLKITDNGVGFVEEQTKSGDGLTNLTKRARELPAQISIESSKNKGTEITVIFTLKK
jgi:signal transduction histidine kinase